ncbi:glycerol-3-phosphate dehydrogenase (NAD(P)+) [Parelusimicrobium proximum]|uniref:NAD(P)H-dependent glycerol-3-phosphate dehydrogenase n=1 Tax=Parelusimicrobium proximum TaxID=3228953 RepID=UPI003D179FFE
MDIKKITVFGAGVWGSVIAQHLADKGYKIYLWEYSEELINKIRAAKGYHPNIPGFKLHDNIGLSGNLEAAVENTDMLVFVISSKSVRGFCKNLNTIMKGKVVPVISASKGIEDNTFKTVCEVIEEEMPHLKDKVMAFTGPSFALEAHKGIPTKVLMAGADKELTEETARVFTGGNIVTIPFGDRRGAEYGGAIKNVVAIGCGILDGIGDGNNTKAALITEAMQEMAAITESQGGTIESVYSLAGLGDAVLTGMSSISRNRRLGEKLGQGKSLEEAKVEVGTIAEGADSVNSVYHIAKKNNIKAPVIDAIWQILSNGANVEVLLKALGFNK